VGCIGFVLILAWSFRPAVYLAIAPLLEKKGEESGHWLRDRLVGCGPRAIHPTIEAIRQHSAWESKYAYLPQVLNRLGEPAHDALLKTIDSEKDLRSRAYLTSALQEGFGDFSRLDHWLKDAVPDRVSPWALTHLSADVRQVFPTAPQLQVASGINPEFVQWWKTNRSNGDVHGTER